VDKVPQCINLPLLFLPSSLPSSVRGFFGCGCSQVRDYVDKVPRCADSPRLNLLVSELTDSAPLLFLNSDKRVTEDVASSIEDHTRIGSACLNDLEAILGSMALRNSSEARHAPGAGHVHQGAQRCQGQCSCLTSLAHRLDSRTVMTLLANPGLLACISYLRLLNGGVFLFFLLLLLCFFFFSFLSSWAYAGPVQGGLGERAASRRGWRL